MDPLDLTNPDPQPYQLVNELRQRDTRMGNFRVALMHLRATDPNAYIAFVAAIRETHQN